MATYNDIKKIKIGDNVFNLYDSGNSGGTITSIKTTAGAHTAINVTSGAVSFNVPTTAAHVGIKFGYTTSGNNRAVQQDSSGNLYVTQKDDNSNTTYTLSGALSSHKFTSTLTAGGSGSGTSTSALTLAAGSNVTLTDNTSTKTITIAATDTKYSAGDGLSLSSTTFSSLNSNLVNGSATGSLRGINTLQETTSYTMGTNAFAEGESTTASGSASHAEGSWTQALGNYSHAGGKETVAVGLGQTVIGTGNLIDTSSNQQSKGQYAFIIGNGSAENNNANRSNALTVDWSGNVNIASGAKYKINGTALSAADVGALASDTTYVSKITTTAGAHTTISNKSGAVSFNVPTKTSHLTNDSGFTTNTGTVTGVKINGTTKSPTSGVVDLGTVITSHQTIPVTSVNSKTGAVSLSASDVEAMPATTLLWTNSSPTSSFTAKTVSLDLSAYNAIEIEFKHASSSNSFLYQKFKIPSDDMSLFYAAGKSTYFEFESRAVTVTTTGVTFADGRRAQGTWTASSDNIRCVPTRIFGIK